MASAITETEEFPRETLIIHAWGYWFDGEKRETYCETEYLDDMVIEIQDLTENRPEDLPGWRILNLETKEVLTGTAFLARHG